MTEKAKRYTPIYFVCRGYNDAAVANVTAFSFVNNAVGAAVNMAEAALIYVGAVAVVNVAAAAVVNVAAVAVITDAEPTDNLQLLVSSKKF